jgi:hypothetical protein
MLSSNGISSGYCVSSQQSRGTSVSTAMSYGVGGRDSNPGRGKRLFAFLPSFHTGFGGHLVSYPVGTGAHSLVVNRPGHEADHSFSPGAHVKNDGVVPPLPQRSSWRCAEVIKHRNNFTYFLTSDSKFLYRNLSFSFGDQLGRQTNKHTGLRHNFMNFVHGVHKEAFDEAGRQFTCIFR